MRIAVDKNTYKKIKKDGNDYIYLFDNETLDELIKTGLHCINYQYCEFVDINLTDYDIDCIKKASIDDKDWNKIEFTNYKIGIMTRVKPELIRCPVDKQDYWVINGTDNEVRPYRILIKEL